MYGFQLCSGGGGGRRGKPRQSRIYNWEWTVTRKFPGERWTERDVCQTLLARIV